MKVCKEGNIGYSIFLTFGDTQTFLRGKDMTTKTVPVKPYRRSPPSTPPYQGPGNKPGPKPVPVAPHKRSPPSK